MNHDPLCPMTKGKSNPLWKAAAPIYDLLCECELIAQVREDELAKCIEAIDDMVIDTVGNSAATVDQVLDALRGLQEKP